VCASKYYRKFCLTLWVERKYPKYLKDLAAYIYQPRLPDLIRRFLFNQLHPDDVPGDDVSLDQCPYFSGRIFVYHSAIARIFVPVGHSTDDETGFWVVKPEFTENGRQHLAVIHLDCIARAAHLTGVYGSSFLPDDFDFSFTLDVFHSYFVNSYADHHMHEFLT